MTKQLVPMAFVAEVSHSIAFYAHLGFTVENTFIPPGASAPAWAWLTTGPAHLMVSKASHPVIADQQAVLFYLYVDDIQKTHAMLTRLGLNPGPIEVRFYAPKGEFRLIDPDGYVLMIMQAV